MRYASFWFGSFIFAFSISGLALESDKKEPIQIESDSLQYDSEKKVSLYQGNVLFKQGTRRLSAEKAEVTHDDKGIQRLVAYGSPATYQEELSDKTSFVCEARKILYDVDAQRLELVENAVLRKNKDIFTAQNIVYSLATKQLESKGGRTRIVIYPKEKSTAHD